VKPGQSAGSQFSKREIVLFILVMILATTLTVWGTFYFLKTFVLGNPSDSLTKAGGLPPFLEREVRKEK
jgi:hypothetical protein